jgi:hypothetical protein
MNTQVSLELAMPLLAESATVRERLQEQFPGIADDIVSLMQWRDLDNPLGQEVHDFLLDEIGNTAEVVWTGLLLGVEYGGYDADDDDEEAEEEDLEAQEDIDADGDIYPIEIRRYGGVYVVWALESGEEGYFLSFTHAKDYIDWNWPEAIEIRDAAPDYVQALTERKAENERAEAYLATAGPTVPPDDSSVRFCAGLPEGLPAFWHDAPVLVEVGLVLTEYNCIYGGFSRDFGVNTVEDALLHLARDDTVFLQYRFFPRDISPGYLYDVDWPLLRRGTSAPQPRQIIEDDGPPHWDETLFEIRNEPLPNQRGRRYLQVGGHTPTLAIRNWLACAQVLRPMFRRYAALGR